MSCVTVLVVEDDAAIRRGLVDALRYAGYAVIECDNGRFGIINLHALDSTPDDLAAVAPIDYDGEESAGRVARREQRWTPVVTVPW